MFKEMTDAELLDFCEDNFCEYKICQVLKCHNDCKDEDCPLVQLFDRFRKKIEESKNETTGESFKKILRRLEEVNNQ